MTQLLDLAPEILTDIVRTLSESIRLLESDDNLYKLALACRTLFRVTEPFLHTKFVQSDRKSVCMFLRTILEKPTYAARVKILCLQDRSEDYDYFDDEDEDEDEDEGDEEAESSKEAHETKNQKELALFTSACDSFCFADEDHVERTLWLEALIDRKTTVMSALLLSSLSTLERLSITTNYKDPHRFISRVLSRVLDRNLPNCLREISCGHLYPEANIGFNEVQKFLYLPNLRTFEVWALAAAHFTWGRLPPCTIETLNLAGGGVDNTAWHNMFGAMRSLKNFSYSPGNPKHVGFLNIDPSGLGEHLPLLKSTLESLELLEYYLQSDETDLLGSLHNFPKLKSISIQAALLIGGARFKAEKALWEYLPAALEDLTLWGNGSYRTEDREDIPDQIVELVMRKDSHFPELRKLEINQLKGEGKEALRELCLARGVQLCGRW